MTTDRSEAGYRAWAKYRDASAGLPPGTLSGGFPVAAYGRTLGSRLREVVASDGRTEAQRQADSDADAAELLRRLVGTFGVAGCDPEVRP